MKARQLPSILSLLVAQLLAGAPPPKLIREIDLNKVIREPEGWLPSTHSVRDIEFSPDGKWIAAALGIHIKQKAARPARADEEMSHIVVVPFSADKRILEMDHPGGASPWENLARSDLRWSPGSDRLFLNDRVYAIREGQPLRGETRAGGMVRGFVDGEHWLALRPSDNPPRALRLKEPWMLGTFDLSGTLVDTWSYPFEWKIGDVSPDRHSVIFWIETRKEGGGLRTLVMDYPTKSIVQDWPEEGPFLEPHFAEGGRTLCSVGSYGRGARAAQCFDTETGKRIAEFSGFKGGIPGAVSTKGSRIVLTHIRFFPSLDGESDMRSYKDRIVWDFRSDKQVAEWVPRTQSFEAPGWRQDGEQRWGPNAISPTGRYLAEGANGVLRIYELP